MFFLPITYPPRSTLFPYTTLFRAIKPNKTVGRRSLRCCVCADDFRPERRIGREYRNAEKLSIPIRLRIRKSRAETRRSGLSPGLCRGRRRQHAQAFVANLEFNGTPADQFPIQFYRHILVARYSQPAVLDIFHFRQPDFRAEEKVLQIFNDHEIYE